VDPKGLSTRAAVVIGILFWLLDVIAHHQGLCVLTGLLRCWVWWPWGHYCHHCQSVASIFWALDFHIQKVNNLSEGAWKRRVGPPVGSLHGFALKEEVRELWLCGLLHDTYWLHNWLCINKGLTIVLDYGASRDIVLVWQAMERKCKYLSLV
jgi:hypothetical protein